MNKLKERTLDFLFVLPPLYIGIPPGGYLVVFQLSNLLQKYGKNVGILFLRNPLEFMANEKHKYLSRAIMRNKRKHIYLGPLFERSINSRIGFHFIPTIRKLMGIKYENEDIKNLDKVSIFFNFEELEKRNIVRIFAGGWETSFFVNEFKKAPISNKFYIIHHAEDDNSHSGALNSSASASYKLPLRKIVINRDMYKRFQREDPILIKDGIDLDKFKLYKLFEQRKNTIMFPLREFESKGAEYALKMAELIHTCSPNIKFISFGDYNSKVPSYIDHHGVCSDSELIQLYNKSAIFVLPSLIEGFSIPTAQAMACGCVPVVTNCGGVTEYVSNGINGIIVPLKDSDALKEAVLYLIENPELMKRLSNNGQQTIQGFSLSSMYNSFISAVNS